MAAHGRSSQAAVAVAVGLAWLALEGAAQESAGQGGAAPGPHVIASCDFEGPYSTGEQQLQDGLSNNWVWGRKDMLFTADRDSARPGATQRVQIRGMASGAMQLFYTKLKLKKDPTTASHAG